VSERVPEQAASGLASDDESSPDSQQHVKAEGPSNFRVIMAPWRYIFWPERAAEVILRAHSIQLLMTAIIGFLLIYLASIIALSADFIIRIDWSTGSIIDGLGQVRDSIAIVGFNEGWDYIATLAVSLLTAWFALTCIQLPMLHVGGSLLPNIDRAARTVLAAMGSIFVLIVTVAISVAVDELISPKSYTFFGFAWWWMIVKNLMVAFVMLGISFVLFMSDRSARAVFRSLPDADLPLLCESCSYDFTYLPESGICPECGTYTAVSTDPTTSRWGIEWENRPTLENWISAIRQCLFRRSEFYTRLQMQSDDAAAWRFTRVMYFVIAVLNASYIAFAAVAFQNESIVDLLGTFPLAFMITVIAAWIWHRGVGVMTMLSTLVRKDAAEFPRVRKIWLYESSATLFVWLVQIAIITALTYKDGALGEMILKAVPSVGIVIIPLLLLGELGLCFVACSLRYRKAIHQTRWSNF